MCFAHPAAPLPTPEPMRYRLTASGPASEEGRQANADGVGGSVAMTHKSSRGETITVPLRLSGD